MPKKQGREGTKAEGRRKEVHLHWCRLSRMPHQSPAESRRRFSCSSPARGEVRRLWSMGVGKRNTDPPDSERATGTGEGCVLTSSSRARSSALMSRSLSKSMLSNRCWRNARGSVCARDIRRLFLLSRRLVGGAPPLGAVSSDDAALMFTTSSLCAWCSLCSWCRCSRFQAAALRHADVAKYGVPILVSSSAKIGAI